jgi:hypothetical protein
VAAALLALGCSSGDGGGGGSGSSIDPVPSDDDDDEDDGGSGGDDVEETIEVFEEQRGVSDVDSYQKLAGQRVLAKNYLQLRTSADACVGATGLAVVRDDMFASAACAGAPAVPAAQPGDERVAILGRDKCGWRGSDVFDLLQGQLWSPVKAGRSDTLAGEMTPPYLQALAMAADVVAHSVPFPATLCDSQDKARDLLARCLPLVPAARLDETATSISAQCTQGARQARAAIATIIGSAAFAAAVLPDEQ